MASMKENFSLSETMGQQAMLQPIALVFEGKKPEERVEMDIM